eukprot:COSAG05_NODE_1670_length_4305_cov_5.168093_3_plen_64_part_00
MNSYGRSRFLNDGTFGFRIFDLNLKPSPVALKWSRIVVTCTASPPVRVFEVLEYKRLYICWHG